MAISLPLYWVVGGPFLMFPLLCALREALIARRIEWAVACIAVGAGLPYLCTAKCCGDFRRAQYGWRSPSVCL